MKKVFRANNTNEVSDQIYCVCVCVCLVKVKCDHRKPKYSFLLQRILVIAVNVITYCYCDMQAILTFKDGIKVLIEKGGKQNLKFVSLLSLSLSLLLDSSLSF